MVKLVQIKELLGLTLSQIIQDENIITLKDNHGRTFEMFHDQDCCEDVRIEEIAGVLNDLIGSPLVMAEERSESGRDGEYDDSYTWTFYELATVKGYVTIRWYGSSNGYYSESVSIYETTQRVWKEEIE